MTDWAALKDAFWAAVDAGPSEQARQVAALRSIDPELAARLEAMLAADARGDPLGELYELEPEHVPLEHPLKIGVYEVVEVLGGGGMGEVYRARDTRLNRDVAIKVLPAAVTGDPGRLARLEREAQLLAALNHPHIAQLYGLDESGDAPALVMELVEGPTLAAVIAGSRETPLPVARVCEIARQIAEALEAAHEKGIVHRDLKPSNVALTRRGDVKVLDFGVAKTLDRAESQPRALASNGDQGLVLGTPAYMSPEQARGLTLDERTDVWAFGCLLYELLTGRQPFAGVTPSDTLAAVVERQPNMALLPCDTPNPVRTLVHQCLEKDPALRLRHIAEARRPLDEALGAAAGPSGRNLRSRAWGGLAMGAVVLSLSLLLLSDWWLGSRVQMPLQAVPLTSLSGVVSAPSLSPDGTAVVFSWSGAEQRNRDLYIKTIAAGPARRMTTDAAEDHNPSWSPDGRAIAFVRRDPAGQTTQVWVLDLRAGSERKLADIRPNVPFGGLVSLAWCAHAACVIVSDSVAAGQSDALFTVALANGEKRQVTFPQGLVADLDPAISPDGRSLIFRRHSAPLSGAFYRVVLDERGLPQGEPTRLSDSVSRGTSTWTRDGRYIIFPARRALWRMDALQGGTPQRLPYVGQDGHSPVIAQTPDGKQRLVYMRSVSDSNVWRLELPAPGVPATTGAVQAVSSTRDEFTPAVSPDGSRIAFWSNRSGEPQIWTAALDGSDARQLTSMTFRSFPAWPRWSPDGRWIAFQGDPEDRPEVLLVPADGGTPRVMTAGIFSGAFPSFAQDGRTLYFCRWDGPETRIWKMPEIGKVPVRVTSDPAIVPLESPDGRHLYYVSAADRPSPLWRMPAAGGRPVKVVDGVLFGNFAVVDAGIYYLERIDEPGDEDQSAGADRSPADIRLQFHNLSSGRTITIATGLGMAGHGLSASRDGRHIFFSRVDSAIDELMLVEDFR